MESVLTVLVVFAALYKVVEVIIHRKERITLVEKLDKLDLSKENNLDFAKILGSANKNWALRVGGLLLGIGLGVLIGYFISLSSGIYSGELSRSIANQQSTIIYSSCTLLFGGLGLLTSFFVERKLKDE